MSQPPPPHQPEYGSPYSPQSPAGQFGQPVPPPPGQSAPGAPLPPAYGAQPGYDAQPGHGFQPGFPAAPPPKKSRVGKILLSVVAAVLVLCVAGGVVIWATVGDEVGEVVEATKTRVVEPETLNGRPKVTDPELLAASTQMAAEIRKDVPESTSAAGAFYGDPAKQDLVMIVGVSGILADPKQELEDAVTTLASDLGATNMAAVDPGPLGGDAQCGDGTTEGIALGICAWADRGSLGLVVIYFKSGKEAAAEFATIRSAVEQRS